MSGSRDDRGDREAARRRGIFLAVAVVIAIVIGLVALRDSPNDGSSGGSVEPIASLPASATIEAAPQPWLAWVSGGFPPGFRERARTGEDPELATSVVVAGDTRWLTGSESADGEPVDRPQPGFEIPIDAFAVEPDDYAPFLSPVVRDDVIGALAAGDGVLGATSAELRGLSEGATMHFEGGSVRIGAVVPDDAIGWSELLVPRETGRRLAIVDERYLLALPSSPTTPTDMEAAVRELLTKDEGMALRLVEPGDTRYVRVGSGVLPPIVMKATFGEFAAHRDPEDPSSFLVDPAWVRDHLATREVPILGQVTCNEALFPRLIAALQEIEERGWDTLIQSYDGCFSARTVARSPTAAPSQHAYGAAIDINASTNPYGARPSMDERIVAVFERRGFLWGGRFLIADGMHFEAGWKRG
jgi:hypothetical protein